MLLPTATKQNTIKKIVKWMGEYRKKNRGASKQVRDFPQWYFKISLTVLVSELVERSLCYYKFFTFVNVLDSVV